MPWFSFRAAHDSPTHQIHHPKYQKITKYIIPYTKNTKQIMPNTKQTIPNTKYIIFSSPYPGSIRHLHQGGSTQIPPHLTEKILDKRRPKQQNIRSIISIQIFEVAHICQALLEKKSLAAFKKGGNIYTNWTAGLRVVAGVLRVWAGFPVGRKIKNIGTDRRSKKSHTYKRRCDYQRRLWHL